MATANKALVQPANGADVDTWDIPVNANSAAIDAALGNVTAINVTGASGTDVLTSMQYTPPFIVFTGTLTAAVNYQVPSGVGGYWYLIDNTTGAFAITFSSGGAGTTTTTKQGAVIKVRCDGTNIVRADAQSGANWDITSLNNLGLTGVVKGQGASQPLVAATAGTDYAKPDTASTWTAKQTLTGSTSVIAELLTNAAEVATISASAATGTIAYYVSSQSVLFFTANAAANWTINITFASTPTTLDSVMSTGQCITVVHLVTQGGTAYYNTTVQVDGATTGVTTKWQGGPPGAGHVSSIDIYTYVILKTGSATFDVFASQTPFS